MTRTDIVILAQTIIRHFMIIEAAFPHLANINNYGIIKDLFIENIVLEKQGWKYALVNYTTGDVLSMKYLKDLINKLTTTKPNEPTVLNIHLSSP